MSILSIPVDDIRNEERIGIFDITKFNCIYHKIIYFVAICYYYDHKPVTIAIYSSVIGRFLQKHFSYRITSKITV